FVTVCSGTGIITLPGHPGTAGEQRRRRSCRRAPCALQPTRSRSWRSSAAVLLAGPEQATTTAQTWVALVRSWTPWDDRRDYGATETANSCAARAAAPPPTPNRP